MAVGAGAQGWLPGLGWGGVAALPGRRLATRHRRSLFVDALVVVAIAAVLLMRKRKGSPPPKTPPPESPPSNP